MTSREDEWARAMAEWYDDYWSVSVEHHYNHYGDRGIVDLYAYHQAKANVIEVKSESAVQGVTGANEIIRQFNRHKRYFYESEPLPLTVPSSKTGRVTFRLIFIPTIETVRHVRDNLPLYKAAVEERPAFAPHIEVQAEVGFVLPDPPHVTQKVLSSPDDAGGTHVIQPEDWGREAYDDPEAPDVYRRLYELTKDW